jgi:hypothetical protein
MGAFLMVVAGMGWGAYTFLGRTAIDPLARTPRNFIGAAILAVSAFALAGYGGGSLLHRKDVFSGYMLSKPPPTVSRTGSPVVSP